MLSINPLKYRGVFDHPIVSTRNLLPSRDMTLGEEITQEHRESANPTNTSQHVLEFFGFTGGRGKPKYLGTPNKGRVLDQREVWIQIWLQKGRYEHEKELRIAALGFKKTPGVQAKKSS